ncbi:Protein of unknown function [Pyronema omphalodes CBS 100304]|uniref:Uncharacterized protein n=1 Tax=Pyronema omphalodes (strain CBS 100304) TaxID=1076935 RepID=U4LNC3_PYROM|nr:Protein of unknown function [Pyronema omphalodes CBS 100304]
MGYAILNATPEWTAASRVTHEHASDQVRRWLFTASSIRRYSILR